jgi:PAS domain S-box-containing protein
MKIGDLNPLALAPSFRLGLRITHRLRRFWKLLVTPSVRNQLPEMLHQSQLLAGLLAVVILLGVLVHTFMIFYAPTEDRADWAVVPTMLLLGLAFFLNRGGHFSISSWITILIISLAIFLIAFNTGDRPVEPGFLTFLFIPLLFAGMFLAEKRFLLLAAIYILCIGFSPAVISGVSPEAVWTGPAAFMAVAGGMIYLIIHHRNFLEFDRQRELVEKEERYRTLLETNYEGICIIGDGLVLDANPNFARIFGHALSEVVGESISRFLPLEFQAGGLGPMQLKGDRPFNLPVYRKDGALFYIEMISKQQAYRGQPAQVIAIRDVTERVEAEARIHRQLQSLAALRAIDIAITSSLDLRVIFDVLLDKVATELGVDAACILLFNAHNQMLEFAAGRGFRTQALKHTRLRLGEGYAGSAALGREMVSIRDLRRNKTDFLRSKDFYAEGFVTYYAVPLVAKGYVKGVLETFQRAEINPDREWLNLLEALAGQAAIALDNAGLFGDMQRSNAELVLAYDTTIEGWSRALDLRDHETEGHSQRVAEITARLARKMGMNEAELVHVRRGSLLHDIGKMGIPDQILLKPGKLTAEEWEIMKKHPTYAYELLSPIPYLRPALDIPYCHHEKWDGTGYPRGLRGEQIPLSARVFAIVDVWDALNSKRPYRPAWRVEDTINYIRELSETHFDPKVVGPFFELLDDWKELFSHD